MCPKAQQHTPEERNESPSYCNANLKHQKLIAKKLIMKKYTLVKANLKQHSLAFCRKTEGAKQEQVLCGKSLKAFVILY